MSVVFIQYSTDPFETVGAFEVKGTCCSGAAYVFSARQFRRKWSHINRAYYKLHGSNFRGKGGRVLRGRQYMIGSSMHPLFSFPLFGPGVTFYPECRGVYCDTCWNTMAEDGLTRTTRRGSNACGNLPNTLVAKVKYCTSVPELCFAIQTRNPKLKIKELDHGYIV